MFFFPYISLNFYGQLSSDLLIIIDFSHITASCPCLGAISGFSKWPYFSLAYYVVIL